MSMCCLLLCKCWGQGPSGCLAGEWHQGGSGQINTAQTARVTRLAGSKHQRRSARGIRASPRLERESTCVNNAKLAAECTTHASRPAGSWLVCPALPSQVPSHSAQGDGHATRTLPLVHREVARQRGAHLNLLACAGRGQHKLLCNRRAVLASLPLHPEKLRASGVESLASLFRASLRNRMPGHAGSEDGGLTL